MAQPDCTQVNRVIIRCLLTQQRGQVACNDLLSILSEVSQRGLLTPNADLTQERLGYIFTVRP